MTDNAIQSVLTEDERSTYESCRGRHLGAAVLIARLCRDLETAKAAVLREAAEALPHRPIAAEEAHILGHDAGLREAAEIAETHVHTKEDDLYDHGMRRATYIRDAILARITKTANAD